MTTEEMMNWGRSYGFPSLVILERPIKQGELHWRAWLLWMTTEEQQCLTHKIMTWEQRLLDERKEQHDDSYLGV